MQPAQISWDGENFEEVAIFDRDNKAVLNSAGDPFEGLFRERTRRVISIVKNVAAVPDWIITSEDAVNSLAFVVDGFAVPIGKAKLSAPRLGPWEFRNNTRFRQMTMTMKLNKDGWTGIEWNVLWQARNETLDPRLAIRNATINARSR